MSDYLGETRQRSQTLLIVEGNHEKNRLFWLIFQCFPEINIDIDNVWVYGTNIYMLYEDIKKEYGADWAVDDIDLPFVISRKQDLNPLRYKEDFINIILIFDYERHDTNFSEFKILEMQNYFMDAADMGKLYINYPMIESYQHLWALPDVDYINRKIRVSLQPGKKYKELVRKETVIEKLVKYPHKIRDLLQEHFEIEDEQACKGCCASLLAISDGDKVEESVEKILKDIMEEEKIQTAKYHFVNLISRVGYAYNGKTYWEFMRNIFQQIILHNISKANKIQNGREQVEDDRYKECFEELDLAEILKEQNEVSRDLQNGFIWVLNTCVFFVAEYNFSLVKE